MANPWHIVPVTDFSVETLRQIVALLDASTEFEHFVYREAELDAIWSLTGFFLQHSPDSAQYPLAERLHSIAHEAHDLVADGRAQDAAKLLRTFCDGGTHVVS
jgi:hypothetical protein